MCYNSPTCFNCTKFASGALSLGSLVLAIFPCFLAQAVPRLLCASLVLNLEALAPPQGPGSLYMGVIFWKQDLSARYAHCYSSKNKQTYRQILFLKKEYETEIIYCPWSLKNSLCVLYRKKKNVSQSLFWAFSAYRARKIYFENNTVFILLPPIQFQHHRFFMTFSHYGFVTPFFAKKTRFPTKIICLLICCFLWYIPSSFRNTTSIPQAGYCVQKLFS